MEWEWKKFEITLKLFKADIQWSRKYDVSFSRCCIEGRKLGSSALNVDWRTFLLSLSNHSTENRTHICRQPRVQRSNNSSSVKFFAFFICLRWFGWMDGSYWKWPKVLSGDSWKELEAIFQELESLPIIAHHSNRSQCVFHTTIKHSEFCFRTNSVRNQINQEYW